MQRVIIFKLFFGHKNDSMEAQVIIKQPNAITNARYDYTKMQKDFMYHYLNALQNHMSKETIIQKDLFGALTVELDLKDICKSNNHSKMLRAIKDLQKRPISFSYNRENNTYDVSTVLISSLIHKRNTGRIQVKTTEESLQYIMWLGNGFTSFNFAIAIFLPSTYAQRIYEICCKWKDKGFYRVSLKEFRERLYIEELYPQICELRENVLDKAQRMLEEQADVRFTYEFRRENGSRSFNWLEFRIESKYATDTEKKTNKDFQYVYMFLYEYYRDTRAFEVAELLAQKFDIKKAAERFRRLQKDIKKGKVRPHGILAYLNAILHDEYDIADTITARKKTRAKKNEEAALNMEAEAELDGVCNFTPLFWHEAVLSEMLARPLNVQYFPFRLVPLKYPLLVAYYPLWRR